eukprot:5930913-Pyramimonas_sp.AAC.1
MAPRRAEVSRFRGKSWEHPVPSCRIDARQTPIGAKHIDAKRRRTDAESEPSHRSPDAKPR